MKNSGRSLRCVVAGALAVGLTACSPPPSVPALTMGSGLKQLQFDWIAVADADHYRLFADLDGSTGFVQVGSDLSASTTSTTVAVAVHLYPWTTARYTLEACNSNGCSRSPEVSAIGGMLDSVGYLKASNAGVDDQFGGGSMIYGLSASISQDGNTLAVSSIFEDSRAAGVNGDEDDDSALDAGAVYVFVRGDSGWVQQAYVKASNAESSDQFGYSVALSGDGDTLAVGANLEASNATGTDGDQADNSVLGAGAVYVFDRSDGVWSQQAYVKASNTDAGDVFGYQVALSFDGNTLAVAAQGEDSAAAGVNADESNNDAGGAGAAYVFSRIGDDWLQQAYIKTEYPEENDLFGSSIAISDDGNTLVVGALDEDGGQPGVNGDQADNSGRGSGATYVFARLGEDWSQQAYIKGLNTERADAFGAALAISADGNTLAVGAPDENNTSTGANADFGSRVGNDQRTDYSYGAAYVFTRQNGAWAQQGYIKPSHIGQHDQFGTRVALSDDGNLLAVGVPLEDSPVAGINGNRDDDEAGGSEFGAVYLFTRSEGEWSDHSYVKSPNAGVYDEFGSVVVLDGAGTTMIVGARFEDSAASGINGDRTNEQARDAGAVYIY
ncbi:MAG: integrin [Gammaproteobacteria bacterium]